MKDNLEEKDIIMEQKYIEQKLKTLDDYLVIPNSIRPENICFKYRRRKYIKNVAAAAIFVIIISVASVLFILRNNGNRPFISSATADSTNKKENLNKTSESDNYIIKSNIDNYDDLKMVYSKLINKSSDVMDVNYMSGKSVHDDTSSLSVIENSNDTGDIVKTNGEYIFTLSTEYERSDEDKSLIDKSTAKVNIVSTLEKGTMKQVGAIDIDGQAIEMYLTGKMLIVIARPEPYYIDLENNRNVSIEELNKSFDDFYKQNNGTVSYEMTEKFYEGFQYENRTQVLIYDVSDINRPIQKRKFIQDGYYSCSKLIGDNFYLITNKYDYKKHYDDLNDINPENILPFVNDSLADGVNKYIDLSNITVFSNPNSYQYTVISGFNVKNSGKVTTEACLGGVNTTYSSSNCIYFTSTDYNNFASKDFYTNIMKYSLNNAMPKLLASGKVSGAILNKAFLDEYNDYFRIATVNDPNSKDDCINNIYILDNNLKTVGKEENLLPDEQINSVRFIKDTGYLITNKKVDPLFSLDLSNPSNPKLIGEIKIPGFTSYLCPYSDTKLIGVGKDVQIKNLNGEDLPLSQGIKLSFFDISNPDNPVELKSISIGGRGTSSEVLYDSKSLLFSKDNNILAFPVTLYENKQNTTESLSAGVFSFIGYYIYTIDDKGNFIYKDRVTHYDKLPDYTNSDDNNFFDNIGYEISRGVKVDGVLYTVSEKMIMANSLSDFKQLGKIQLKK